MVTRLAGAQVLITGARGFVGPHLIVQLVVAGATVHGTGPEPDAGDLALASWHRSDLREPESLVAALAAVGPSHVVHLAAQSSAAASFEDPAGTFDVNTLGTWRLLEAMRAVVPGARMLVVGTGDVYGPRPVGSRAGEDTAFQPVSPYALSKAAADAAADVASRRLGLDVVRARAFGHLGPGQTSRFFLPAMAEQIAAIETGAREPVLKVGNLEVVRDLTDVRDVVKAYVALLEHGERGRVYNVCRGEGTRLADLARDLAARARVPVRIDVDPTRLRPADVPYLVGDPARIHATTGWSARIPLAETAEAVLAEWRGAKADRS
jgi:GDP-4-dehydro-6-deoxy-D-mannose reductase